MIPRYLPHVLDSDFREATMPIYQIAAHQVEVEAVDDMRSAIEEFVPQRD
jgi:hypothetical protein